MKKYKTEKEKGGDEAPELKHYIIVFVIVALLIIFAWISWYWFGWFR